MTKNLLSTEIFKTIYSTTTSNVRLEGGISVICTTIKDRVIHG